MRIIKLSILLLTCGVLHAQQPENIQLILNLETACPLDEIITVIQTKEKEVVLELTEEVLEEDTLDIPPPPPPPRVKKETASPILEMPEPLAAPLPNLTELSIAGAKFRKHARKNKLKNEYETPEYTFYLDKNKLWGVKNKRGKTIVSPRFTYVKESGLEDKFIAREKGQNTYNLYDLLGNKMLAENYEEVFYNKIHKFIFIRNGSKQGWVNADFSVAVPAVYDRVYNLGKDLILVKNGENSGVFNRLGAEILPLRYRDVHLISTDDDSLKFLSRSKGNQIIVTDSKGEDKIYGVPFSAKKRQSELTEGRYLYYNGDIIDLQEEIFLFCGKEWEKQKVIKHRNLKNLFFVKGYPKSYYFNAKGEYYPNLSDNYNLELVKNRAIVSVLTGEKDEHGRPAYRYGLKDEKLNEVLPTIYTNITGVSNFDFFVAVNTEGAAGLVNREGNIVIPFNYATILENGEEYLAYSLTDSDSFKVYNSEGKILYHNTGIFKSIKTINEITIAYSKTGNIQNILNKKYQTIFSDKFFSAGKFTEETIWIQSYLNGKSIYKIINNQGESYSPQIEGQTRNDYRKLAKVEQAPFFFIDFLDGGKFIFNTETQKSYRVDALVGFVKGKFYSDLGLLTTVSIDRKTTGLIDAYGKEVIPMNMDKIIGTVSYTGMIFGLVQNGASKVFDKAGNEIFAEYETARHITNNMFAVRKNGKMGVLTLQEEEVLPFKFKSIRNDGRGNFLVEDAFSRQKKYNKTGKLISPR